VAIRVTRSPPNYAASKFEREILRLLAGGRSPESYVGGATVPINILIRRAAQKMWTYSTKPGRAVTIR
jgi:hypothetical protein